MSTPTVSIRTLARPKSAINFARDPICTQTPRIKRNESKAAPFAADGTSLERPRKFESKTPRKGIDYNNPFAVSPEKYKWKPLNANPGPG